MINDSQLIFDPNVPEIQFYTGSGTGRTKKVSISPIKTLSDSGGGAITLNFTGSYSPANPSITTNAGDGSPVDATSYSARTSTGGPSSNGTFTPADAGDYQLTIVTPSFAVETGPDTISHTSTEPNFQTPYNGYIHTGYSNAQQAAAYLYIEAVKVSDNSVVGSHLIGSSTSVGAKNVAGYWEGYNEGPYALTTWTEIPDSINAGGYGGVSGYTQTINMYIDSTTPVQFRYRFLYYAYSGVQTDIGASPLSYTSTVYPWTFDTWTTSPSFASSIIIKSPTNFVEINAGGMQVVSDENRYVKMARQEVGVGVSDLLKVLGGNIKTDTILPNVADISTIGTYANQYGHVYANNFTNNLSSIGANGYTKLTNGIILQWGYQAYTTTATPVLFPQAFPTACTSVHVTTNRLTNGAGGYNHAGSVTTAGFSAVFDGTGGWWSAIGY